MAFDETATSDPGGTSPAVNDSGSSPETNTSALAGATGSDVPASAGTTSDVSTTGQETTAPASEDPFAKYAVSEDANLQQIREKHRELLNDHRAFQKSTEPLTKWNPLAEKYQTPESVEQLLGFANGLFAPAIENGQQVYRDGVPVTTTLPAIQMLAQESPATLIQLSEDLANFEIQGKSVIDWQLEAIGLDPNDIPQYLEWKKNGLNVAQQGGDVSAEDLAQIPPQYQDVFKGMPPQVREDLLLSSEMTREQMLRAAKSEVDSRTWVEQQQTLQQQQMEQAQVRQRQEISQAQEMAVNEIRSSVFSDVAKEIMAMEWKASADETVNQTTQGLVMAMITAAADQTWRAQLEPFIPGIKIDGEAFDSAMGRVDQATRRQIYYEKTGDPAQAKMAKADRDNAVLQIKAKASGLQAAIVEILSGTASEKRLADESRLQSAASRPAFNGRATAGASQGFQLPTGRKPFDSSPETIAALQSAMGR